MACEVNQIFLGEIASVQNYGAFVRIPGCKQQGLIHRSQISSSHVDDVNEVLQRGERVWCKVISIAEDGKIALSMKFVNQGNGKDLDPNGVQMHLDEQKKKKMGNKEERKAIVLDAVYKTICSKCKTPGHLSKDCFSTPDGKKYELLPEEEEPIFKPQEKPQEQVESKSKEKKHKLKKSKKRKRSKSSKRDTSDSEDSDSSDEKSKKKKKKSKDQKRKKKRRHDSSSDSDSNSSVSSYENKKHSKKCKHSKVRHSD